MFMPWLFTMLCASFRCLLLRVGSDHVAFVRTRSSTFVCLLHGLVLLPYGISGKMTIPSKSLLSLLASCSLFCYAAIPTTCFIITPILPCSASNPPRPSKPLFRYVTALLSPSYSVVSSRWRLEFVPCWNMDILLGYHNISYLINASIYLVKGGRLGLMPSVLFHSCRPSFHHIGVMFPDFAFLTRLGYNGNPLIVRLD